MNILKPHVSLNVTNVDASVAFAEASPLPDPADATRQVTGLDLGMGNL